ncbi:MAG TPA: DUF3320 domain-containing protein [Gammaproteobacteria bacterium]|nr:DUF3320 domain-containing protein [Gammaproteobacteria bacterium]
MSRIQIKLVEFDERVNFARQQNAVPVIRSIVLANTGETTVENIVVEVQSDPGFAELYRTRISSISPGESYELRPVDLTLSPGYLGGLAERLRGQLAVSVLAGDQTEAHQSLPINILAYDEWAGIGSIPELIAAFSFPNHPATERYLRAASIVLEKHTGSGALDGYQQQDRKRVWAIAASIYATVMQSNIAYCSPPASFEERGQKIRTPDRIESTRLATCLDSTLLFSACLEQAGLHPVIVFFSGHALPGVWLHDESFETAASDDLLSLRKRVDMRDICAFESTAATRAVDFNTAVAEARSRLNEEEDFRLFIDVARARHNRIQPLPIRGANAATAPAEPAQKVKNEAVFDIPDLPAWDDGLSGAAEKETPQNRLERWRAMLLDLTLNNRLLNFKESKKTVVLQVADPAALEDHLAEGSQFRILPNERLMERGDGRQADVYIARTGENPLQGYISDEMQAGRLHSVLGSERLDRHLLEIYRAAKEAESEGGANTLYLAIGFLSWVPQQRSEPCLAPLVLVPVELSRRSVNHGFTLCSHDDDTIINISLLQLLERDFDLNLRALETLPTDDAGVDIPQIINIVRHAVRDLPGWEVQERVALGLFSFNKYLMWKDLQDHMELIMQSSVVDHLLNHATESFGDDGEFPQPDRLDREYHPKDTFCPLPADSSQLAAIFAAAEGRTFVLEGPPGTGKSQTIANIVAQCLMNGKTVLFVSEKAAALNVVYDRLDKVGLGPFCLELHSKKARKREVVEQLARPLAITAEQAQVDWEREAVKLADLRSALNDYVEGLHRQRSNGLSLYRAIGHLLTLNDAPAVAASWPSLEVLDGDNLSSMLELLDETATAAKIRDEIGNPRFDIVCAMQWTPALDRDAADGTAKLHQSIVALLQAARSVSTRLKLADQGWSLRQLEQMHELTKLFLDCPAPPRALLAQDDWKELEAKLDDWIAHGKRRDALRQDLLQEYQPQILELDLAALRKLWQLADQSWFMKAWLLRRRVTKALRATQRTKAKLAPDSIDPLLALGVQVQQEENLLSSQSDDARHVLGRFWRPGESNWDEIHGLQIWSGRLRSAALSLSDADPERARALRDSWAVIACADPQLLRPDGTIGSDFIAYREAFRVFTEARDQLVQSLELDFDRFGGAGADYLGGLIDTCRLFSTNARRLREWTNWRRSRNRAIQSGFGPVIAAYESGSFEGGQLAAACERSLYRWWFETALTTEPAVRDFFSAEHERKLERFREQDSQFTQLTRKYVRASLAARVPRPIGEPHGDSEIGILARQAKRRRGLMPIRQLIQSIPNILPRLAPCVLMSPLSIAQYLPAGRAWFDVVVFDEASQITPWDALGAIARGKSLVVAGDSKQMPPTNFFNRSADAGDEPDPDEIADMESILEECTAARIPSLPLTWHYRSRHESLIAFSNYEYYENRLLSFPSPYLEGMGVEFRYVDGAVYDRGKSRTNRAEAEAIVAEIAQRLHDPSRQHESIGVVTFNIQQQRLIEDLLENARLSDSELDRYFAEDAREPVFIKNLENVQGDERDVILFSICFGKDAVGRSTLSFGAINREGGQRRLNVAITRARKALLVYSSIRYSDIDLNRTNSRGVADLRSFLEYAERGAQALYSQLTVDPGADTESPFEDAVKMALLDKGWQVHSQVGCSGYRIDLAILDPRKPGQYLAAVECDGATYHSAHTARDRDRLRQAVLEDLGWTVLRVWSTDWWHDPAQQIDRLQKVLGKLLEQPPRAETRVPAAALSNEPNATRGSTKSDGLRITAGDVFNQATRRTAATAKYQPCQLDLVPGEQSAIYEGASDIVLVRQIHEVADVEGPVLLPVLARRVGEAWGFQQVTQKLLHRIEGALRRSDVFVTDEDGDVVIWRRNQDPISYRRVRVPGGVPEAKRSSDEIPLPEIANALRQVLESYVSMTEDALVREAMRILGFQRLTQKTRERMADGLEYMTAQPGIQRNGDGLIVISESASATGR